MGEKLGPPQEAGGSAGLLVRVATKALGGIFFPPIADGLATE